MPGNANTNHVYNARGNHKVARAINMSSLRTAMDVKEFVFGWSDGSVITDVASRNSMNDSHFGIYNMSSTLEFMVHGLANVLPHFWQTRQLAPKVVFRNTLLWIQFYISEFI